MYHVHVSVAEWNVYKSFWGQGSFKSTARHAVISSEIQVQVRNKPLYLNAYYVYT